MKLARLQDSHGEVTVRLTGAVGLVGFVDEGHVWGSFVAGFHDAFLETGRRASERGSGPAILGPGESLPIATQGFDEVAARVLAAGGLTRAEYAAVWFGAGSVSTWLQAGRAMMRGGEFATEIDRLAQALDVEGAPVLDSVSDDAVSRWMGRLIGEVRAAVEDFGAIAEELAAVEERIANARGELAEIEGNIEAGMVTWVRERQDAETRLLLYRDREQELRKRLEVLEEKGPEALCVACTRPLAGDVERVKSELAEEWEAVVQDGRWWRRRRDQLEFKPEELKEAEARALVLSASLEDDTEELERTRNQLHASEVARERLAHLKGLANELGLEGLADSVSGRTGSTGRVNGAAQESSKNGHGDGSAGLVAEKRSDRNSGEVGGGKDRRSDEGARATLVGLRDARERLEAEARGRLRARIHGKVTALTAGRLVGSFPELYEAWEQGGRRGGGGVSILELAARITLAELAVEAGVELGSIVFPTNLDRLNEEDLPRALADLSRLTRKVPLVLVQVTEAAASAAPEQFDLLYRADTAQGAVKVRRQRLGVGSLSIASPPN